METQKTKNLENLVQEIGEIGLAWHSDWLFVHAESNKKYIKKTTKDIVWNDAIKNKSSIVICGGPSLHKRKTIETIKSSEYGGTIVACDASYVACLKRGVIPDFVLTLDPHESRIVRWFGDHDFEKNNWGDDYFKKQDLDIEFRSNQKRNNEEAIDLVNKYGHLSKAIISTSAPKNVVDRVIESGMDMYWFNPLVDNPREEDSLTRKLYGINKIPCFNTGGNVGTAAWVFANAVINSPIVALTGMDLGYYKDLPVEMTQTFDELVDYVNGEMDIKECFKEYKFPLTNETYYVDPTFYWYRKNFFQLLEKSKGKTINCTEGGTLFSENIIPMFLKDFIQEQV